MGRWTTVVGVLISIGTAYLVMQFASIMDYVQAALQLFSLPPLFGTCRVGDALETRDTRTRRIFGIAVRHGFFDWHVGVGQNRSEPLYATVALLNTQKHWRRICTTGPVVVWSFAWS